MIAAERIKQDLATYFQKNNITDIEQGLKDLQDLLTPAVLQANNIKEDSPSGVIAWTAIQIKENSPYRYLKSKDLGEFIYNSEMHTIKIVVDRPCLHYNDTYSGEIELPEGCTSTENMFHKCAPPKGFTLGDKFDTSNVTNMCDMFCECKLPEGFTLGDKFDTSNVTKMNCMFANCKLPDGFTLGDKFDTSNVTNMDAMFLECRFSEGFTLGDKFDTSKVTYMTYMFAGCKLPEGFTLGNKFDTSNVKDMGVMFKDCKLPEGFTLGDKFDTSNITDMTRMFANCKLPKGFTLGNKFDTFNVEEMEEMFSSCQLPEGFTLGGKFDTSNVINMESMFKRCKLPDGSDATNLDPKKVIEKLTKISEIDRAYMNARKIKDALLFEYNNSIKSGIYGHTMISMTYNSNKIEGSHLSEEETTNLFETGTVFSSNNSIYIPKDVEESRGHFIMFNNMLKTVDEPLSERLIKSFHYDLKCGVFEDKANGYNIGEYKGRDNRVGNIVVASAKDTPAEMKHLLDNYHPTDLDDLLRFHVNYETIHPFQDGNGRTGRLILFRECLRLNLVPVLIYDDVKSEYIRSMNAYREINDIGRFYNLALTLQKRYFGNIKYFITGYKENE